MDLKIALVRHEYTQVGCNRGGGSVLAKLSYCNTIAQNRRALLFVGNSIAEQREDNDTAQYDAPTPIAAFQPLYADVEEPDGTYYEYDRNLKATVKVTPDGERTPVVQLEAQFARPPQKGSHKTAHEGMIP